MYKLPKTKKILKAQEFKRTLQNGKKFVVPELVLFAAKAKQEQNSDRLGMIVTKKIGNAVERNRVKRRLREIFRQTQPINPEQPLDLVFIARNKVTAASFDKIEQSFKFAYKNLVRRHQK